MPDIIEEFPNVKFVIAGDGPDVDVLKDQVERLTLEDYVIFAGNVEHGDVGNYYRMADLLFRPVIQKLKGLLILKH